MGSDAEELSARRGQGGQHLDVISIQDLLLP
jgi:hypothetical protein